MYRVLIVDDEPLVLIGVQGMLDWNNLGFEICGTARNGKLALDFIENEHPDLVITDIKMPVMNGITLARECHAKNSLPVFIMLTSFEDFQYARDAMHCGAIEYLVKLELNPESLTSALQHAKQRIEQVQQQNSLPQATTEPVGLLHFRERFFSKLYNGHFTVPADLFSQAKTVGLDFTDDCFLLASCDIVSSKPDMDSEAQIRLTFSTMRLVETTLSKYLPCYATGVDLQHFYLLFCLTTAQYETLESTITPLLLKANQITQNYFSVILHWAFSQPSNEPLSLAQRAQSCEQLRPMLCEHTPLLFSHKNATNSEAITHKAHIVAQVQEYICEHLAEKLTLNDVATTFNFSPNYMSQLFVKYGDSGFVEFITETRIARAKQLLAQSDFKIYEIANMVGFETAFYFSKVFKKIVGVSPREYQQQL